MNEETAQLLRNYLGSRYLDNDSFYVDEKADKVLFKICYTDVTCEGVKKIIPVKSHFYISDRSYSYKLGFRLGIVVRQC
jgi:hypothetical protein